MELPATLLGSAQRAGTRLEVVPLSDRLQAISAARLTTLPEATRQVLLLATFEGTPVISEYCGLLCPRSGRSGRYSCGWMTRRPRSRSGIR